MRFIITRHANMLELLFIYAGQCLNVNKSLKSICSSYKVTWIKPLDLYGFLLQSL